MFVSLFHSVLLLLLLLPLLFYSSSIRFETNWPVESLRFRHRKEEKLVGSISASKWGGEKMREWVKFSRIVIERRRIDVPRARGEKIGNQRVLEYCQRCKIDCIFVEIFSFSPERTRLETRWNFLRRIPTPGETVDRCSRIDPSSAGVVGNDAARECNRRVYSSWNESWKLSLNLIV